MADDLGATGVGRALITWRSYQQGGRRTVLPGRMFVLSRFSDSESWTLIVDVETEPNAMGNTEAAIQFLMPDAPHALIHNGASFELMDGPNVIP